MVPSKNKKGRKPSGIVKILWSKDFAYAIGLIASDGSLSKDGRHISFSSKELEQILNFKSALGIPTLPGSNYSSKGVHSYRVQISDVEFYRFLNSIGLFSAKSLTISALHIPREVFSHFLRGYFDGDGYVHFYLDKRWKSSLALYIGFVSASLKYVEWLRAEVLYHTGCNGHMVCQRSENNCYTLRYAKEESLKLAVFMYKDSGKMFLPRKHLKIKDSLAIVGHTLVTEYK